MKKQIAILLAICLLSVPAMAGCGNKQEDTPPAATAQLTPRASTAPMAEATPAQNPYPSFSLQRLDVAIGGMERLTILDEDVLCIYLDYTNASGCIIQPSNELAFDAVQKGESLEQAQWETQEQRALIEDQHRRLFPGATNRAAIYYLLMDDTAEVSFAFQDRNEDVSKEFVLDPSDLLPVTPPPANPPAAKLAAIEGYVGNNADFKSKSGFSPGGELTLARHAFIEEGGEKFVVVYFDLVVTCDMEEGETKEPFMMTNCYVFQDGIQLGSSVTYDDRAAIQNIYEQIPELAAHMQDIGPNEPVTTAILYRLRSGSDISIAAAFSCSDFTQGEDFIGDTFSVK